MNKIVNFGGKMGHFGGEMDGLDVLGVVWDVFGVMENILVDFQVVGKYNLEEGGVFFYAVV